MSFKMTPLVLSSLFLGSFQALAAGSAPSAASVSTIEEPLASNGAIRLYLGVERVPGIDKNGDLKKQLDADLLAPAASEASLAPVAGDKILVNGIEERWLPVRLEYGYYEFQSSPVKAGGLLENSYNYIYCRVISPTARKAVLSFGTDDSYKFLLNGELVGSGVFHRGAVEDSDKLTVQLKEGVNTFLARVDNYGGGAGFICKILDESLKPMSDLKIQVDVRPNLPEIRPDRMPSIPAEDQTFFGARIPRTMALLESSGPLRRTPVKILVYGQSITAQTHWVRVIRAELEKRYPFAKLQIENRAIGGHVAPRLAYSAINDLYSFYPDLVIFQVYCGENDGSLERIFSDIKRRTTAEIITWTDHLDLDPAIDAQREDGIAWRKLLASKYNIELVDVNSLWKAYLEQHALSRRDLLADGIHPNCLGGALIGKLVARHFRYNANSPSFWGANVRTYEAGKPLIDKDGFVSLSGSWTLLDGGVQTKEAGASLKLDFVGNRVDLVAPFGKRDGKFGTAKILIDGKAPSALPCCYASTRARCDFAPDGRPGFRYVRLGADPVAEDWTLKITNMSDDLKSFDYEFVGSKTGSDGSGHATPNSELVSKSGRVAACGTFNFHEISGFAKASFGAFPKSFGIEWKVWLTGSDLYAPKCDLPDGDIESYTVVQGLPNTAHTLEIVANGDGPLPLKEIVVFEPPLK